MAENTIQEPSAPVAEAKAVEVKPAEVKAPEVETKAPSVTEETKKEKKEETPQAEDPNLLVPLDMYLKAGLHIGTKFRTKYMSNFIYKVRTDGLTVLNVQAINERIKIATQFISRYAPEDIIVVGKRENGWRAMKLFSKITGIRVYPGRYHPGIMTNPQLEDFQETKLIIATDPWPDKDALKDAAKVGAVTVALCDTNNDSTYVDLVVPCNNKGRKSLGLFFWILAREYMKARHPEAPEIEYKYEDFVGDLEQRQSKKRNFNRSRRPPQRR